MDPMSDVLGAVRLTGAYFYLVEASTQWSILTAAACDLLPRVLPDAEHLISYHILVSGSCWCGIEGDEQVEMRAGDVILFPHGDPHYMSSHEGLMIHDARHTSASARFPNTVVLGDDSSRDTVFICGFLGCDVRPFNPLVSSLPRMLRVPGIAAGWLSQFTRQAVTESRYPRVGSNTMLTRMAELMFIEVMRHFVAELPGEQRGWLRGLRDEIVGPALVRLHEHPDRDWTIANLAQEVATSRTVLAERFSELVGIPPMLYLTRWRLQLASQRLLRSSAKIATVATQVGYDSEAAFSRAFKRETGLSPAAWREHHQRDQQQRDVQQRELQ
ncbi:MAG: AraC family transcriptional regulator [Gemmatimonas sp.]